MSLDDDALPNHLKDQYLELPLNKRTKDNMDYSMDMVESRKRIDSALKQSSFKKPGVAKTPYQLSNLQTYV